MSLSIFRPDLFKDKTILVTGGATGIGLAICTELSSLGARVIMAARNQERLQEAARGLGARGYQVGWHTVNIREEDSVRALFDQVADEYGRLDALVNNAGGQFASPAHEISAKGWHAVVETNLTGTFLMTREAFLRFFQESGGSVVSIVADMWRGFPGMAHTGAARAGVVNLTRTLAVEWAAYGVRVNAVAPGVIEGHGLTQYPPEMKTFLEQIRQDTPAKRYGTEAEVSAAVTFLLSPAAAYISGEIMKVDGAGSLWRKTWTIPDHQAIAPYLGGE